MARIPSTKIPEASGLVPRTLTRPLAVLIPAIVLNASSGPLAPEPFIFFLSKVFSGLSMVIGGFSCRFPQIIMPLSSTTLVSITSISSFVPAFIVTAGCIMVAKPFAEMLILYSPGNKVVKYTFPSELDIPSSRSMPPCEAMTLAPTNGRS